MLQNLLLFCGGSSVEHEVSLRSARFVAAQIDRTKYTIFVVVVGHDQEWRSVPYDAFMRGETIENQGKSVALMRRNGAAWLIGENFSEKIDMVFPVIHGTGGEDGSLQGLLDYAGVPYVGNGVLASAITMDKIATKQILMACQWPVVPFLGVSCPEKLPSYALACAALKNTTLVIKPASSGSSVGVSKVFSEKEYLEKSALAFAYDERILIESAMTGAEVECAVLGNAQAIASGVGEIVVHTPDKMYSYQAKYHDPDETQASVCIQAQSIAQETQERIRTMAVQVFHALTCSGLARIDFFVTQNDAMGEEIFINEINTMPGFTAISLYPQLWNAAGISAIELIAELIRCAQERFDRKSLVVRQAQDVTLL